MKKSIFWTFLSFLPFVFLAPSLAKLAPLSAEEWTISDQQWVDYKKDVLRHQPDFQGWCSKEKASRMMDLIYETKPEVCVEVGVFGGSSIYPTASALKFLKQGGKVYAIDSWDNSDCTKGYSEEDINYQWWHTVNLKEIYTGFIKVLNDFDLDQYCIVMKTTGSEALEKFEDESIDILHIDANHSEEASLNDAKMYLSKVKKGGYIWFDDVNWPTTQKAWEFLGEHCTKDPERSTNEYFLFKKQA